MKALIAQKWGGVDALTLGEADAPRPGPDEVLIAVGATGLHPADLAALKGDRHPQPDLPFIPGLEAAGIVAAVGKGVQGLKPGTRVAAFLNWGGLAEGAVAKAALCAPLPDGIPFPLAASLPVSYAGALLTLRDRAALQAGETLLVLGAVSHAGYAAVQIAKHLGARVIAVARGDVEVPGADAVVDDSARPLSESVATLTQRKGVDVIFDCVGGDAFETAVVTLAHGGRVVAVGSAGRTPKINMAALYARDAELIAANTLLTVQDRPTLAQAALREVIAWTADGSLTPRIGAQFPISDVKPAFDYVKARRGSGAVIVTIGTDR